MKKLSKKDVANIKKEIAAGVTQPEIAAKRGVGRGIISDIATGRRHADVPWPDGMKAGKRTKAPPRYNPENEKILELEAEVSHLLAERDHARKQAKAGAKLRGLFKSIVTELDARIQPMKALPTAVKAVARKGRRIDEHVVMHLSDMHADQVITPDECGGLEEYNFPIACARAERYVDTVVEWTQDTLSPKFHFTSLTVLSYGDQTSGEIHGHGQRSYYRNTMKNCLAIGQLQALMYRDLAAHFDEVNVLHLSGNHGRRSTEKNYNGPQDNWDYLIGEIARLHCRGIRNVHFTIPNAWSANVVINGVGMNISHGDDVRGNMGVPWYGLVRRQKGLIALGAAQGSTPLRYFVIGHHHCAATLSDINGEMIVNGAWPGTDAYSYNAFSGYREPCQWLHGMNPRHGITWRMAVQLKHAAEKHGPSRYKIDGGRDVGPLLL